jgi:hypothetical protein
VTSMRKTRLRLAAAVLPALLLTAACSGSSDDKSPSDAGGHSSSGSSAPGSSATAGPQAPDSGGRTPLTKAQLTSALIATTDVPGYQVQVSQTDDTKDTSTLTSDKPQCQPMADITSSKPAIVRKAFVGAAFAKATATGNPDEITQMLVASHAQGDAKKVIASLRDALSKCTTFTATDNTGVKTPFAITRKPAASAGDEAVSYVMTDTKDAKTGAASVTVVRTGETITAYLSVKSAGGPGTLPVDVARKQSDKLKAAQAK